MTALRISSALFALAMTAWSATSLTAQDSAQPSRTTATYGGWTVDCYAQKPVEGQDTAPAKRCEMVTKVLTQSEEGDSRLLLTMAIGVGEGDSDYWVVFETPLNVLLREQVRMFLNAPTGEGAELPEPLISVSYLYCEPARCLTRVAMTTEQLNLLTDADTATVRFVGRQGREFRLPIELDGFAGARAALNG